MLPLAGSSARRTAKVAEKWLRLSCRARHLSQAQKVARAAALPPYSSQSIACARKSRSQIHSRKIQYRTSSSSAEQVHKRTREPVLPSGPARTRFAPSPTGYLHIGGLRTALFSYLLARRTLGQFLLRIEDTDQKRLVLDAEERLCDDLHWAGLQWDEGPGVDGPYGPYRQSERTEIYRQHAETLLNGRSAYRCFCVPRAADVEARMAFVVSGCYQNCSSLSSEESQERAETRRDPYTVRLGAPKRAVNRSYPDLVYGKIPRLKRSAGALPSSSEGQDAAIDASDTILMKSDGTPTYHFANVIDDHLMHITHVIRGSEWMASTPLHYDIYSAFGWEPPQFAHVGLLVDQKQAKLSKRNSHLALDVASLRDGSGILPDALNNFLALLGWSNPTANDVMDLDALVREFDLKFTKGNTMVRMEKLWFLQKAHVALRCERAMETKSLTPIVDIVSKITAEVKAVYPDYATATQGPKAGEPDALTTLCAAILLADSKSYQNASQFVQRNRYFFARNPAPAPSKYRFYDKAQTLTPGTLQTVALRGLKRYSISLCPPVAELMGTIPADSRDEGRGVFAILAEEAQIHAALDEEIQEWLCRFEVEPSSSRDSSFPPRTEDHAARFVPPTSTSESDQVDDSASESRKMRHKAFRSAMMKFLRETLCEGLPGPSMDVVLAILGTEESCARLRDSGPVSKTRPADAETIAN